MFKIFINDGNHEIPKDDTFYIVSKNGIYLKKKVGIVESVAKVDGISILHDVMTYAKLHIKKIPGYEFSKIVDLFRRVYKEYRSEAVALLYYNQSNGKYKVKIPQQEVSMASLNYEPDPSPRDFVLLCSIHSHGSMSAFHSGTDKHDESGFTGLHITIGKIDEKDIDICASISSNNSRFPVDPIDYIDGLKRVLIEKKPYINPVFSNYHYGFSEVCDLFKDFNFGDNKKKEEEKKKKEYETRYRCDMNISHPNHWFKNIKERTFTFQSFNTSEKFSNIHEKINTRYLEYYKNQYKSQNKTNKIDNSNTNLSKDDLLLLEKIEDDDYNPCEECVFRDCKVDMQKEDLEDLLDEFNDCGFQI